MMKLLLLLLFIVAVLMIAITGHLSYVSEGIITGVAVLFIADMKKTTFMFEPKTGFYCVGLGVLLLLYAYYVTSKHGITFEALAENNAQSFRKKIRHLPAIGIASITTGVIITVKSVFQRERS